MKQLSLAIQYTEGSGAKASFRRKKPRIKQRCCVSSNAEEIRQLHGVITEQCWCYLLEIFRSAETATVFP
jgi:hypothetical protein